MDVFDSYSNDPVNISKNSKSPYTKHDYAILFTTAFLLIAIPLTVFAVLNAKDPRPKAASLRGLSGDLVADVIIGRRDFTEVLSRGFTNPKWLDRPGGVVVDRDTPGSTLGYLYAQSTRENRIMALNLDNCIPTNITCSGEKVFGQPELSDFASCNRDGSYQNYPVRAPASNATLCFIDENSLSTAENLSYIGMYTQGGNLYTPDTENHRILVYKNAWNDQIADEVIGQDNFSGNSCNKTANNNKSNYLSTVPSASSLCLLDYTDTAYYGSGVVLDLAGNLWVADNGNHRVLRFPKQTDGTLSKTADIVLGQTNFTSGPGKAGTSISQMKSPNSLRVDPGGNLYVSDSGNKRVLKYSPAQQKIAGVPTVFVSFTNGREGTFVSEVDPINVGLWVVKFPTSGQNSLELYDYNGTLKKVLPYSQAIVGSQGIMKNGNLVINSSTQGITWVATPLTQTTLDTSVNKALFDGRTMIQNSRLNQVHGVDVAANKLFVTDLCRVLVWNDPTTLTSGKDADSVLIQQNFNTMDCNINHVGNLKADSNNRVWVKTRLGIYVYDATNILPTGTQPIKIISGSLNVLGGGTMSILQDPEGLMGLSPQVINGQLFLWIVDRNNNRVIRVRDPLGSPLIDVVIGQTNITANACNRGQSFSNPIEPPLNYLCLPGHISIDKFGNIFISDHSLEVDGNFRLLVFRASDFPSNNTTVIFNKFAFKSFPRYGLQNHATWKVAFDSKNNMVAGYNAYVAGRFVGYYTNPLEISKIAPDGYLKDFYSMSYGVAFDSQDNLYVTDINRPRVMIYKNPFNTVGKEGDVNNDTLVNALDLSIILSRWGTNDNSADLNKNGNVDIVDLSIVLSRWGS